VALAGHAYSVLDSYLYGFALNEQALPLGTPTEVAGVGRSIVGSPPADAYPHLAEFIVDHALQPGDAYAAEFAFGLELILDGLGRWLSGAAGPEHPGDTAR
jgi:hypothetical protein